MEKIFVLIKVNAGNLEPVFRELRQVTGIKEVHSVTGTYDILAIIEGDDIAKLLSRVVREVREVEGIVSTETLIALDIE